MATKKTPAGGIHIDLPAAERELDHSIDPDVATLRERVARVEAAIEHRAADPAAAEALRLAGDAHQLAAQALERAEAATRPPAAPEPDPKAVLPIVIPPSEPAPEDPGTPIEPMLDTPEPRRAWWHPSRIL